MAVRLPGFNPLERLKGALVGGQRQIGKAAGDIRSVADELGTAGSLLPFSKVKTPQPTKSLPKAQGPPPSSEETSQTHEIATACVPCALGHFSRSAGALEEGMRFKDQGITSNEILDRVGGVLKEQNTLERYDLTPEKLQRSPPWEREIAERALFESRRIRHVLEGLESIEQLETVAAETAAFYRKLNREWFQKRFAHRRSGAATTAENKVDLSGDDSGNKNNQL